MKLSMVLARDLFGIIGIKNKLPWHVPADLALFKRLTKGKVVVMGRKTWESLPVKPLPDRLNIIITSKPHLVDMPAIIDTSTQGQHNKYSNIVISPSIKECLDWCRRVRIQEEIVFIGGKSIYEQVEHLVDEVHVSELNLLASNGKLADPDLTIYSRDFEDIGFVLASHEEIFDDGKVVTEYMHYVRPLSR